jgi:hypothetical protein
MFVTDFSRIESGEIYNHNKAHRSDVNWLNAQITLISGREPERAVIIFTHHIPTLLEASTYRLDTDSVSLCHRLVEGNVLGQCASQTVGFWSYALQL